MEDKDIINALECCKSDFGKCNDCYYCECPIACFPELAEDALLLIKRQQEEIDHLKAMNNWISVDEKLPPKNTAILCLIKYAKPDKWFTYALLTLNNGEWEQFWGSRPLYPEYQVTHWQPLPEPPKGDE